MRFALYAFMLAYWVIVVYQLTAPMDIPASCRYWYNLMRASRFVARNAGRVAIGAECAYWDAVESTRKSD